MIAVDLANTNPIAAEVAIEWSTQQGGAPASFTEVLPDPTILDIYATVTRAGIVSIRAVDELTEGRESKSHGTASSIVVLDANGATLSEVSGSDNFDHPTSAPDAPAWNTLPIGVSLSYPASAVAVEFRRGTIVLLRIDPLSWTLRTAIQSIPDRGFDKKPAERREELLEQVADFERGLARHDLDRHDLSESREQLDEIRKKVVKVVIDYPAGRILELSKAKVLAQIDRIDARLVTRIAAMPPEAHKGRDDSERQIESRGRSMILVAVVLSTAAIAAGTAGAASCLVPDTAVNFFSTVPHFADETPPFAWITEDVYGAPLARVDVSQSKDPPSLMIIGTWFKDGSVRVESLDEFPLATNDVSPDTVSDYSIDVVDDGGTVLATNPYDPPFDHVFEDGFGADFKPRTLHSKTAPIMATIGYPEATASVQFKRGAVVMLEIDPLSGSLRRMIESVPDSGYARNPTERRKALLEKVGAFEKMMSNHDLKGADEKLVNDLRGRAAAWVVDDPATFSRRQYSKDRLLAGIDLIDARLKARIAAFGGTRYRK